MSRGSDERPAAGSPAAEHDPPELVLYWNEDPLPALLRELSAVLLQHPVAVQAAFSALVAEGRRFARTPEGQYWRAALANSELVRRGRELWEGSVLNLLEDSPTAVLPSAVFDAIVQAATRRDLPALLRAVTGAGARDVDRA